MKQNTETIATAVFPLALELVKDAGGEMQTLSHSGTGELDGTAIVSLPAGKVVDQFRLVFEGEGIHYLESYEVPAGENYFGIIEEATR